MTSKPRFSIIAGGKTSPLSSPQSRTSATHLTLLPGAGLKEKACSPDFLMLECLPPAPDFTGSSWNLSGERIGLPRSKRRSSNFFGLLDIEC